MTTRGKMDERGVSAVEYGLIVALIAVLGLGSLVALAKGVHEAAVCADLSVRNDHWTPADPEWPQVQACHAAFS